MVEEGEGVYNSVFSVEYFLAKFPNCTLGNTSISFVSCLRLLCNYKFLNNNEVSRKYD